jgi:hypothetical protein
MEKEIAIARKQLHHFTKRGVWAEQLYAPSIFGTAYIKQGERVIMSFEKM